ncbi:hypothetical protein A8U91_01492 [Halomonas elongata]|uniref:Uncharacterized protein n=1 Tax=Halomonas elongata TaxID=2746 RepID=A0A1B8P4L5_HALEL|nr:hypothetical protein A8U91_01492 [Halomonas elongata]
MGESPRHRRRGSVPRWARPIPAGNWPDPRRAGIPRCGARIRQCARRAHRGRSSRRRSRRCVRAWRPDRRSGAIHRLGAPGRPGEGLEPGLGRLAFQVTTEGRLVALPQTGDHRRDRKTFAGQTDGGCQQAGKVELAEASRQLGPGGGRAGHGDRRPAVQGHLGVPGGCHRLRCQRGRRGAAGVEAMEVTVADIIAGDPHQGEGVAADAAAGGLDDGQCRRRGDGGIHGVTALGQDIATDLAGLRLGRRHHAVTCVSEAALRGIGCRGGKGCRHIVSRYRCGNSYEDHDHDQELASLAVMGRPCARPLIT